jgi:hypothetical protein
MVSNVTGSSSVGMTYQQLPELDQGLIGERVEVDGELAS